jgi:hypothetical protein
MRLKSRPASFDCPTVVPTLALFWTTAHPQSTALTEGQVAQNAAVVIGVRIRAVSREMAIDGVAVSNDAARSQKYRSLSVRNFRGLNRHVPRKRRYED